MKTENTRFMSVNNIEKKPKLFLKIYEAWCKRYNYQVRELYPAQDLADAVFRDAQAGEEYAQFLKLPKNEIIIVCEKENITRAELARQLKIPASRLENCVSRGKCSKPIKRLLSKRFNYIGD